MILEQLNIQQPLRYDLSRVAHLFTFVRIYHLVKRPLGCEIVRVIKRMESDNADVMTIDEHHLDNH